MSMDREAVRNRFDLANQWIRGAVMVGVLDLADRTGVLRVLAAHGPSTAAEVAASGSLDERYVLEMLSALAAGGVVSYDGGRFAVDEESIAVFGDEASPYFVGGLTRDIPSVLAALPLLTEAVASGRGVARSEYPGDSVAGAGRVNAPSIRVLLVRKWLAAMPDVVEALTAGGRVLDVGCGIGAASLAIAAAHPAATVEGIDIDAEAIAAARRGASELGAPNVTFRVANVLDLDAEGAYDLVVAFDTIHDIGEAFEALRRVHRSLAENGTFFMVEPDAGPSLEANLDERGAFLYGLSALLCLPLSRSSGDDALGTAWGPRRAEELARAAGFTRFERLPIENPVNAFYRLG
jgi:SAM-dependent methyltransferase